MEASNVIAIPTVTTIVPSSLVVLVAIAAPIATMFPTASTTTSTIGSTTIVVHPSDEASKLIKAMEDMSIQTNEINGLKEQIKILEDEKNLVQIMHKDETQKSNRLNERLQKLEK